jgi:MoxR-like ATPase
MEINRYRGAGLAPDNDENNRFPYIADKRLVQAVNMAIALHRPLLVKGPPGCGKTRLAMSIAHELGLDLYEWYIKSTSRARDGLYTIDMVRRLQDAQLRDSKAQRLVPYIRFGQLGEAIRRNTESVVLIDEIDKADIDFPNDLLRELDEKKLTIEELDEDELTPQDRANGFQKTYETEHPPIIIITSNDEKELPDAFLRRCLFYYIEFPDKPDLLNIIRVNTPMLNLNQRMVDLAVDRMNEIRKIPDFRKSPATSELIDWVRILHYWKVDVLSLGENTNLTELPFWEVLFKNQQDLQQLSRQAGIKESA